MKCVIITDSLLSKRNDNYDYKMDELKLGLKGATIPLSAMTRSEVKKNSYYITNVVLLGDKEVSWGFIVPMNEVHKRIINVPEFDDWGFEFKEPVIPTKGWYVVIKDSNGVVPPGTVITPNFITAVDKSFIRLNEGPCHLYKYVGGEGSMEGEVESCEDLNALPSTPITPKFVSTGKFIPHSPKGEYDKYCAVCGWTNGMHNMDNECIHKDDEPNNTINHISYKEPKMNIGDVIEMDHYDGPALYVIAGTREDCFLQRIGAPCSATGHADSIAKLMKSVKHVDPKKVNVKKIN